jgi:2-isopropylmalate synthase
LKEWAIIGDLVKSTKVFIYDTTLRDGSQAEGISFTVEDKLKIVKMLDEFGIDYIEAGNPGSNPKDLEFFKRANGLKLRHSVLTAFGSTRRAGISASEDANVQSLLSANTTAVAIFGKSWDFHVTDIIRTTLAENLSMIKDTISYLKAMGKEVVFDAEHFFDGFKNNSEYALKAIKAAEEAGASSVVLCDTNGGTMPHEIFDIVGVVRNNISLPVGIHCHDDGGVSTANSIMAIHAGATQVQGTINGYGERCGNANLCTIIPDLQFKLGYDCIPEGHMLDLTKLSRYVSEVVNQAHNERAPYVGNSAFAHKGGMHIDAVLKNSKSFEHIDPEIVGNERRILMSEVSGRSTILKKIRKEAPWITKESPEVQLIIDKLKQLEHEGYQFEGAESSFSLMVKRALGKGKTFFNVRDFRVFEDRFDQNYTSISIIRVEVEGVEEITAAEGDGPVNAIDKALRKVLEIFYPSVKKMRLTDYKVRVLDTNEATGAKVRVHIESTNGEKVWGTVGVSTNIIEASLYALIDSIEYFFYMEEENDEEPLEEAHA